HPVRLARALPGGGGARPGRPARRRVGADHAAAAAREPSLAAGGRGLAERRPARAAGRQDPARARARARGAAAEHRCPRADRAARGGGGRASSAQAGTSLGLVPALQRSTRTPLLRAVVPVDRRPLRSRGGEGDARREAGSRRLPTPRRARATLLRGWGGPRARPTATAPAARR